jgi:hypothetical protein
VLVATEVAVLEEAPAALAELLAQQILVLVAVVQMVTAVKVLAATVALAL